MTTPVLNPNVVAEGLAKLTSAYADKRVVNGLLKAILLSVQDLETNAVFPVMNARNLKPSVMPTGDQLTKLAAISGVARNGLSDADLWATYQLQLIVYRSRGRAEDIMKVANALVPGFVYAEYPIAAWEVTSFDITASVPVLAQKLTATKRGGTRGALVYTTWPVAENLIMAYEGGPDYAGALMDDTTHAVTGAGWMAAAEGV
jgi:hypothetical protein